MSLKLATHDHQKNIYTPHHYINNNHHHNHYDYNDYNDYPSHLPIHDISHLQCRR